MPNNPNPNDRREQANVNDPNKKRDNDAERRQQEAEQGKTPQQQGRPEDKQQKPGQQR